MLTPREVRMQLDALANEVAQPAGLYYELYSRLFSERVEDWIETVPPSEAELIRREAQRDFDYSMGAEIVARAPVQREFLQREPLFNPAWDLDY